MIRGAGPDHPWDVATEEWLQAASGPKTGWNEDVSSLFRAPLPPPASSFTPPTCSGPRRYTHGDTARPQSDNTPQRTGPPGSPWRASKLEGLYTPCPSWTTPGDPYSSCSARTLQPRCARSWTAATGCKWEAVADGNLLALLHQDAADEFQWDMLAPHPTWRHVYMATPPPRGTPARRGMTSSPPSTTTGFSPTTRGGRSSRRRSAGTTGATSVPACWRSRNPFERGGTTSCSAISALGRPAPTSHTPATSAGNADGVLCNANRRQQVRAVLPRWSRAPGPNLLRARTGPRRRGLCTGASEEHTPPHTNARAPRAQPACGSTCTCGAPSPSCTCHTCLRPDPHPPPHFAGPAAPCLADRGTGPGTPGPAANRKRQPSGAW